MSHPAAPLLLSHGDRNILAKWSSRAAVPYRVVTRAKALLMAGDGASNSRIATTLRISLGGRPWIWFHHGKNTSLISKPRMAGP